MKKSVLVIFLLMGVLSMSCKGKNHPASESNEEVASGALVEDITLALKLAIDDEQKALATYKKVIEDFGEVRPFINIIRAEQRHIDALLPFFVKYDIEVPENPYVGNVEGFASIQEACQAGVDAEVANVQLYDRIFDLAVGDANLMVVFENLQAASQENHLPAFKRCAN